MTDVLGAECCVIVPGLNVHTQTCSFLSMSCLNALFYSTSLKTRTKERIIGGPRTCLWSFVAIKGEFYFLCLFFMLCSFSHMLPSHMDSQTSFDRCVNPSWQSGKTANLPLLLPLLIISVKST